LPGRDRFHPQPQRDEKNFAQKESNDFFRGVCESLRYGLMSYACEQEIREVLMLRAIQKIGDNHTSTYCIGAESRSKRRAALHSRFRGAGGAQHRGFLETRSMGAPTKALLTVTQDFVTADTADQ